MANIDPTDPQVMVDALRRLFAFKIASPPPDSNIPPRRFRNHILVTEHYSGHGITRAPGEFLCLRAAMCNPAISEHGTLPVTCAECLRSVRRIHRQKLNWRERRAVLC